MVIKFAVALTAFYADICMVFDAKLLYFVLFCIWKNKMPSPPAQTNLLPTNDG
jgi:hypothetical protein